MVNANLKLFLFKIIHGKNLGGYIGEKNLNYQPNIKF